VHKCTAASNVVCEAPLLRYFVGSTDGAPAVAKTRRIRLNVASERTPSSWNDRSAGSSQGSSAAAASHIARSAGTEVPAAQVVPS